MKVVVNLPKKRKFWGFPKRRGRGGDLTIPGWDTVPLYHDDYLWTTMKKNRSMESVSIPLFR